MENTLVNRSWDILKKEGLLDEPLGMVSLNLIRELQKSGLCEESQKMVVEKTQELLNKLSSTETITNDPACWVELCEGTYQHKNIKNAFSTDGGNSYYFQNDPSKTFLSEKA